MMDPIKKNTVYCFLGSMISLSINLLMVRSLSFTFEIVLILGGHFILWAAIYLLIQFFHKILPIFVGTIIGILGFVYYEKNLKMDLLWEFFPWAFRYIQGIDFHRPPGYDVILTVLLFVMVDGIIGLFITKRRRPLWLFFGGAFFVLQWYRHIDEAIKYFNLFLFAVALLLIYENYSHYVEERSNKKITLHYLPFKGIILYSALFIGLILFTANSIPLKFNGFSLRNINDSIAQMFPMMTTWRQEGTIGFQEKNFSFEGMVGLSRNGKLGGSIQPNDNILLLVEGEGQLYLRGTIRSRYTGERWLNGNSDFKAFPSKQDMEEAPALKGQKVQLKIYPIGIDTDTIFAPYKPVKVEGGKILYNQEEELKFSRGFFQPRPQSYTVMSKISQTLGFYPESLWNREKESMKPYLQLPETVPERIKNLAVQITNQYQDPYRKMKALEDFLRKNYTYTLQAGTIPKGRDFVDYFLFEEKKGYCTYFSTSLAILGRCVEVPTRYVEGFMLPHKKNQQGYYEVTGNQAHAWVEAYFEGWGWIGFEPTPAYPILREERLRSALEELLPHGKGETGEAQDFLLSPSKPWKDEMEEPIFGAEKGYVLRNKENRAWENLMEKIGVVLLSLMVILTIRGGFCFYKEHKWLKAEEGIRDMKRDYYRILCMGKYLQPFRVEGWTPREYLMVMVTENLRGIADEELIRILEKGLFSQLHLSVDEIEKLQCFLIKLDEAVKRRMGMSKYLYHKYLKEDFYQIK